MFEDLQFEHLQKDEFKTWLTKVVPNWEKNRTYDRSNVREWDGAVALHILGHMRNEGKKWDAMKQWFNDMLAQPTDMKTLLDRALVFFSSQYLNRFQTGAPDKPDILAAMSSSMNTTDIEALYQRINERRYARTEEDQRKEEESQTKKPE